MTKKRKKVAICHYRVGKTDGVSLEIAKRKQILEKYGCDVKLIAGKESNGADYIIKELGWNNYVVPILRENGFVYFNRNNLNVSELREKMNKVSDIIEKRLDFIQQKEKFDAVLIHNIFSFGCHTAAAKPFARWIKKNRMPCLSTNHDFYWERKKFKIPPNGYLKKYIQEFMPIKSSYIKHIVINSLAEKELKKRFGIKSHVFPDIFDFNQDQWKKDSFNKNFLKSIRVKSSDLIILQATRVMPRKGVELAMDFAKKMREKIGELKGEAIYNGKKINSDSRVVLIVAGYAEKGDKKYLTKIKLKALREGINVKFISKYIDAVRDCRQIGSIYSLWDAYVHADIVTFPSLIEGWGNQFIEAVFAKKPIVVFEYPVFKSDIKKEGYSVISLGDKLKELDRFGLCRLPEKSIEQAAKTAVKWLVSADLNKKLERNFKIGKKYHSYKILEKFMINELGL